LLLVGKLPSTDRVAVAQIAALPQRCGIILRNPVFLGFLATTSSSYLGYYTFVTHAPIFLPRRWAVTPAELAWVISAMSLAYMVGSLACHRLLRAWPPATVIALAGLGNLAIAVGLIGNELVGGNFTAYLALQLAYVLCHALHQLCGQPALLGPFPGFAATAAGLAGTLIPLSAIAVDTFANHYMGRQDSFIPLLIASASILAGLAALRASRYR